MEHLDLSSLQKAVGALGKTIGVAKDAAFMKKLDTVQRNAIRAGVIQHFEVAYELSWKFMQRWLRLNKTPGIVDPLTRKDLFRLAAKSGLIDHPTAWFEFGEARNITSHGYDQKKAALVYKTALKFLGESKALLQILESRN